MDENGIQQKYLAKVHKCAIMTTVDRQIEVKLNKLLRRWPRGVVEVSSSLGEQGIYRQLSGRYVKSGWIKRIGQGAFVRGDDKTVSWPGGLYAIQQQLGLRIHVSGKTALEQKGYAHFIAVKGAHTVWLSGEPGVKLPGWFRKYQWGVITRYSTSSLIKSKEGIVQENIEGIQVAVSAPERAILELLEQVPVRQSFEEAHQIMENLTTLRPKLVSNLLRGCTSIKVKRLFLYLADYCRQPWLKYLNRTNIDLGSGNRSVVKGGRYDPIYRITIPREFKK